MLSAAMLRGKELYAKIIADLPAALEKYGFKSVQEVIDTQLENHAMFGMGDTPKLDAAKCTGCGTCSRVCPYFAIDMDGKPKFNSEKCFRCGLCVSKCPVKALTYTKVEE
jgi:dihydroorotate dehydrogenase (fumarate)